MEEFSYNSELRPYLEKVNHIAEFEYGLYLILVDLWARPAEKRS
jgi:hypothetical protein